MRHEKEEDAQAPNLRHRVMAGFIGNVVEWYDFALYGYLAGIIAPVFFPPFFFASCPSLKIRSQPETNFLLAPV